MSATSTRRPRTGRAVLGLGALALAALDLLVKTVVVQTIGDGRVLDFGLVNLKLGYNTGVALSLGATLSPWVVVVATTVIVAALAVFLFRAVPRFGTLSRTGAAFLLGGALGNLVDRMDGAGVVDYLHTGWFPTFNLADVFVVGGVGLLILGTILFPAARSEED
ncbi:signal peptidase II [Paenarthrobacter sp. TYUT067]|uniref:signal peptidase II n=1 Tax=unclassified Paenarthrobacter TaxID=2634190 RepID=UPI00202F8958|nr:signal peptidase II [Paenarthrobacter sp. TYUT067]MCM0616578.1 signal peptidase II [Paenarthrobacter sp. TYUT067]